MKIKIDKSLFCGLVLVFITIYICKLHKFTLESLLSEVTEDDFGKPYREYERFVSTIGVNCQNKTRCGPKAESGYTVCMDSPFKPKKPCLVYSFGSHFMFGFEIDVMQKFKCEIHTFDPSIPIAGHHIPDGIHFHLIGLSEADSKSKLGWEMRELSTIRKNLNHTDTILDILKLDIEGYEWKAIPQIISSGCYKYVRQLVIEVHFGKVKKSLDKDGYIIVKPEYWGNVNTSQQLEVLIQLQNSGFQVFHYARNPRTRMRFPDSYNQSIFTCNVISLININLNEVTTNVFG
ncbi:probable methyltransferase-like protein 24 [Mercenaria mercenaria]|uniref:probable methyltransferase-like protein 24 n=1 Tax=Mercenaria mercenaria TaxID=6596 RepID=UPI00234F0544|nr:probable methyltransferase-like protein 24 [Mercenaria mercenaria]